ncbi:MAG: glycosyltransferase [Candidatus Parvarchaeota archaeon]|nr:glycosyltransferase [Candidatus Rehaiarchaeum fermentans]
MDYFLIEVSYEIGNKVGGIWTVITSKAPYIDSNNYLGIGYFNPNESPVEFIEEEPPQEISNAIADIDVDGIKFRYGTWINANKKVILIDSQAFKQKYVNKIKGDFWNLYKIDSLGAGDDYNDPLAWSYAAGILIEKLAKHIKKRIVVQVHEWLSGGAILYLKSINSKIPTVFTTHATVLGRAYSYAGNDIYKILNQEVNDLELAYKYGVPAKHLTEKATAWNASVFTCVSDAVSREAKALLKKSPEIVTINGINIDYAPDFDEIEKMRANAQEKFKEFLSAYFLPYYKINPNAPLILTSGRYEFLDKGYDIFIDALSELDKKLPSNFDVIAFIAVPSGTYGLKNDFVANYLSYKNLRSSIEEKVKEIGEELETELSYGIENSQAIYNKIVNDIRLFSKKLNKERNPPLCPFLLSYPEENDKILSYAKYRGLLNSENNRVKLIFYPKYLTFEDELLGLSYYQLLSLARVGVFLSRYEPFGYTPLEAMEYGTPAITTSNAGISYYLIEKGLNGYGVYVQNLYDDRETLLNNISNNLLRIVTMDDEHFEELRLQARASAEAFSWKDLINNYFKAYELALSK